MNRRQKQAYKWHVKHDDYKKRIHEARKVINSCFKKYNSPYISYSGGKDSIVMTHIALSIKPDVNIWHWDYGEDLMPRKYEYEVMQNLEKLGATNVYTDKRRGDGSNTRSGYQQFFNTIAQNKKKYNWDIGLVGIRQQESCNRNQTYNKDYINDCCYPIRKLTVDDIWAYILDNNLDYPSSYDLMGDYVGWDKIRFVTFFDKEFETMEMHHGIFI